MVLGLNGLHFATDSYEDYNGEDAKEQKRSEDAPDNTEFREYPAK